MYKLESVDGYKHYIENIESYFEENSNAIHQERNTLKVIRFNEVSTIVKSFKVPNFLNQFIYSFFRNSKAKKSYLNSVKLNSFTPEPLGYIEFYSFQLLKSSYFVSEEFKYDFTIREPLLDNKFKDRDKVFKEFANFTLKLHNEGIFHNDYSPGNILIKHTDDTYIFKIVDVNRMHFRKLSQKDRARNFAKLWADDKTLLFLTQEYQRHCNLDEKFSKQVLYYSNKNKKIKNFKKRLKGKAVND